MTVKSYHFKTGFIAFFSLLCQLAPIVVNGQTTPTTYSVQGAMGSGALLKFTRLAVVDAHGNVVSRWKTDSLGLFKITGLTKGRYRLMNSAINIDTPFSVPRQSQNVLIVNVSVCNFSAVKAQKDIKAGKPMLLLSGGIAPVFSAGEDHFEKKYAVKYHDFGDSPPDTRCSVAYNKTVFAFLDKKFGKSWRKDARIDVIGLKR